MCWGSFAVPPAAGYVAPKNVAGTPDSQQHSSSTPENYLDESLLGHVTDDAIFGDLLDGELDMLDCLLKEEEPVDERFAKHGLKRQAEDSYHTNKQIIVADADNKPVAARAADVSLSCDHASDDSAQTPDDARLAYPKDHVLDSAAVAAQLLSVPGAAMANSAAQAQVAAAQQMAAQQMAAQLQLQMGMMPNMATMQMLAANQNMVCQGFPFSNQVVVPNFGFKVPPAAKPASEQDEAVERIKKKRRESAQRSRARKNQYMRALEVENKGLRAENAKLREYLMGYELQFGLKMPNIPCTPVAVRPAPEPAGHDD